MARFRLSAALALTIAGALAAIVAAAAAGWLTIDSLDADTSGEDVAVLAAAVAISTHSGDLMATGAAASDATMNRDTILADRAEVSRIKTALSEQRAVLDGSAHQTRATRIGAHLDSLVSAIDRIEAGRPDLLRAMLRGEQARQELTVTNTRSLFPAMTRSIDNQLFYMLTGESEFRASSASAGASRLPDEELLRLWHFMWLSRDMAVAHTTLAVASRLQNPTFVARTQEALDSIGQRMERSLEFVAEQGGPDLDPDVVPLGSQLREAAVGPDNQLDELRTRLELAAAERELIAASEEAHAALLSELDALAGDVHDPASAQPDDSAGTAEAGRIALLVIGIAGVLGMLAAAGYFGLRREDAS